MSILHLVGGKNGEGYHHALTKTWDLESDMKDSPVKSALTKKRGRVSFEFFKGEFDTVVKSYEPHRRSWRSLKIYATDGDQYELPRGQDILENGYCGYPCRDNQETHYPRMYVVHCYDVLGGITKDFRYSNANQEVHFACEIAKQLEAESLTIYDRLFLCEDLIWAHTFSQSFFLARCKEGVTFKEIAEFFKSHKRNDRFTTEDGVTIELIKIVNPKTGEVAVYATNLPRSRFKNREIADLYALRWEAETANRDLSHTMKLEQWHSFSLNGILQEIYAALWLMNQARVQMAARLKKRCRLAHLFEYAKSNFKLIVDFILESLGDLCAERFRRLNRRLDYLLERSSEKRIRRSRSYPRQVKYSRNIYPSASTIPREAK